MGKWCHDESIKYARLYHTYMNDKTDCNNFIKRIIPFKWRFDKNIENVVMRN